MAATDDSTIQAWIRGDETAGRELYDKYYRRAWTFGLSITRREVDADDLAQEAMTAGLEVLREGKRPEHFTGWLLGVVKHLAWRKNSRTGILPAEALAADPRTSRPSQAMVNRDMSALMSRALDSLQGEDRQLVEKRFVDKESRQDVAEALGWSLDKVDRRTDRAMAHLRNYLSGHFTTLVIPHDPCPTPAQVGALRPSFRECFRLRHIDDLTVPEIAGRLKVPAETVEERLKFAYSRLKCTEYTDFSDLRRTV